MDWLTRQADVETVAAALTDARPASDHPRRSELDPEAERRERLRVRIVGLALGLTFVGGMVTAFLGEQGWADRHRVQRELARMAAEVRDHEARVAVLRETVEALRRDRMARERVAREELGYARPGEVVFLLPRSDGAALPFTEVPAPPLPGSAEERR